MKKPDWIKAIDEAILEAAREDGGVCEWTPGQERPEAIAAKGDLE